MDKIPLADLMFHQRLEGLVASIGALRRLIFGFCTVLLVTMAIAALDVREKRIALDALPTVEAGNFARLMEVSEKSAVLLHDDKITQNYADWQNNYFNFFLMVQGLRDKFDNPTMRQNYQTLLKFSLDMLENQRILVSLQAQMFSGRLADEMPGQTAALLADFLVREYDLAEEFEASRKLANEMAVFLDESLTQSPEFKQFWISIFHDEPDYTLEDDPDPEARLVNVRKMLAKVQTLPDPEFLWETLFFRSVRHFTSDNRMSRDELWELKEQLQAFGPRSVASVNGERERLSREIDTVVSGKSFRIPIIDVSIPFNWLPWASLVFTIVLLNRYRKRELDLVLAVKGQNMPDAWQARLQDLDRDYWFRNAEGRARLMFFGLIAAPVLLSLLIKAWSDGQLDTQVVVILVLLPIVFFVWDVPRMDERPRHF